MATAGNKSRERQGKRVEFDLETWHMLNLLGRDRMMTFQELADEAFGDLLKKHGRPRDVRDAFRRSARSLSANENEPEKKKPAGNRRARSKRTSS